MSKKGASTGQAYHFAGEKARMMARRLKALQDDPEGARALMAGKRPKNYPKDEGY